MTSPLRAYRPDLPPQEPHQPPTGDSLVNEVIDLYLEGLQARHRADDYSADALENATRELRRFGAEFGNAKIGECRQHDITRWFAANPQWESIDTQKRVASTIIGCFRWAFDEELIDRCPYRKPK